MVPCRRVGNLLVMFANKGVYSTCPWTREAALDAVALHEKIDAFCEHRRFNIAAIQCVASIGWGTAVPYSHESREQGRIAPKPARSNGGSHTPPYCPSDGVRRALRGIDYRSAG